MARCKILGLTLIALLIAAATPALAEAAPPAALPAVTASSPVLTNCGPGLDLGSQELQGELCPMAQPESLVPEFMAKPPHHGYCKCGCGGGCTTDADCGPGGQCVRFITCC